MEAEVQLVDNSSESMRSELVAELYWAKSLRTGGVLLLSQLAAPLVSKGCDAVQQALSHYKTIVETPQNQAHLRRFTGMSARLSLGDGPSRRQNDNKDDSPPHIHTAEILGIPRFPNETLYLLADAYLLRSQRRRRRSHLQPRKLVGDRRERGFGLGLDVL